jgi:hypothetical protein
MDGVRKIAVILGIAVVAHACTSDRPVVALAPVDKEMNVKTSLVYDTNMNGEVTKDEMEAGLAKEFAAADRNGDGVLDLPEMQAENQRRFNANQSGFSPVIDWNRDGKVDKAEFSTTMRSLFAEMDTNQNGVLSGDELRIPRGRPRPPPVVARRGPR